MQQQCVRFGAELLVDMYHALNVVPVSLERQGLDRAFVTGGGYKYCQLGEGNCFLRLPPACGLRPVLTGWFSEGVDEAPSQGRVEYGAGAARFAGATYDPTAHYRAAAVQAFHEQHALTPELLREVSRHQIGLLKRSFEDLDVDPALARIEPIADERRRAGFLALRSPRAGDLAGALRVRGVFCDFRGNVLRLGPAPYLSDAQLRQAASALGEVLRAASTLHGPAPRAAM